MKMPETQTPSSEEMHLELYRCLVGNISAISATEYIFRETNWSGVAEKRIKTSL